MRKLTLLFTFLFIILMGKTQNQNWLYHFKVNTGLPTNNICTITIDHQGNKWIGVSGDCSGGTRTPGGIVKFDGTTWTVYDQSNSDLPSDIFSSITIDNQGNKWIGTLDSGLAKFDGTNWTVYNTSNSDLPLIVLTQSP